MVYNMMTCQGSTWTSAVLGGCSMAWISFAMLLFIGLILRRQCNDGFLAGTGFNVYGAFALGLGLDVAIITFTGSARWALIAGIVGIAVGGWLLGLIFPEDGGSE